MGDSLELSNVIKIPVSQLKVGMFVEAIDKNKSKVNIANAGQIRSTEAILKLHQNGITHVWVNGERSLPELGFGRQGVVATKVTTTEVASSKVKPLANKSKVDRTATQKKAQQLIIEAKDLIQKVLSETFEGKAVEVEPFAALADNMIESVMLDADALKCVSALRSKDAYLLEHSINVAFLLVTFGRYLDFDTDMLRQLAIGGILHDIGKIKIDSDILNKPSKLTAEEFEHVKLHQTYAVEIMEQSKGLSQISKDISLMHHEKLDGKGYPLGLKGDEIPLHGRMSCIVDIFDALTATRCYKEAMSPAAAFKILISLTPFHLDQKLVYDFIRCIGVYPAGSLVLLSDGRIGIVWESKGHDALHPKVKCFYSVKHKCYTKVEIVDLSRSSFHIEKGVSPSSLEIDPTPFY
ncbi:HD family phosphohydrolase [Shewanella sairae]|uniref:HD family phosphohydrolase n=1 Tax=Shewanella sairae TaxID=190310 RepID=A0ABQ4PP55_9GAMM|nr:HD-GYP domain-containing protein [Shewanella sairae]MCL1128454.1 HD-GYP domain-containing protein [Shewanella sairae]GIU50403.1 HD family phosphohydrolase [Shewanella sairae]